MLTKTLTNAHRKILGRMDLRRIGGCKESQNTRPFESEVSGIHTKWMSQSLQPVGILSMSPVSPTPTKELKQALEKSPGM